MVHSPSNESNTIRVSQKLLQFLYSTVQYMAQVMQEKEMEMEKEEEKEEEMEKEKEKVKVKVKVKELR